MGTGRAISMPGLLRLKYAHLHQKRKMTKEVTGARSSFCVGCGSDTPNRRLLQAHRAAPSPLFPTWGVLDAGDLSAGTGPHAFHPRIRYPWG